MAEIDVDVLLAQLCETMGNLNPAQQGHLTAARQLARTMAELLLVESYKELGQMAAEERARLTDVLTGVLAAVHEDTFLPVGDEDCLPGVRKLLGDFWVHETAKLTEELNEYRKERLAILRRNLGEAPGPAQPGDIW